MGSLTEGYATENEKGFMIKWSYRNRPLEETNVEIQIKYCGVCRSDLHQARNEWGGSIYPMVPGHEIVGIVTKCGPKVSKHKVGDAVGVGCLVGSCHKCEECKKSEEQYCEERILTYNDRFKDGTIAQGGYARSIVVEERFVFKIPKTENLAVVAPLLCAGATVYGAMKTYGADKKGIQVAVAGLGGLGHMAIQYAHAWGCEVTVLSSSSNKRDDAFKLGANHFAVLSNKDDVDKCKKKFDFILDTACITKNASLYISFLKVSGKLILIGVPHISESITFHPSALIFNKQCIGGSLIAGIKDTQEMLDFSLANNIKPWIELIPLDKCNEAHEKLHQGGNNVKYRFVLDCSV